MSWLARSIVNTLNFNDERDDDDDDDANIHSSISMGDVKSASKIEAEDSLSSPSSDTQQGRGVKEDLSELTKTLTRQFWGVASFLAPPVDQPDSNLSQASDHAVSDSNVSDAESSDHDAHDAVGISGIRSDFAEIGGRFKTGISKLSSNMAVSEITKIASNFLQFGGGQDQENDYLLGGAVGVTEEVLAFARNIALHPETWLDFPLPDDQQDADDFDMSDAQQEHALAVERLAPELTATRIEICPEYMSEEFFWKIYFVLLHPRLDKDDAEILSTPQIMQARAMLTVELQKQVETETEPNWLAEGAAYSNKSVTSSHEEQLSVPSAVQSQENRDSLDESTIDTSKARPEIEKHQDPASQIQIVDKSIKDERVNQSRVLDEKDDDGDDWLKEESSDVTDITKTTTISIIGKEEDVSFSDLEEDDDDDDVPTSNLKKVIYCSDSSTKDAAEWVQLSRSSTDSAKDIETAAANQVKSREAECKESNDWLDVDDIDDM